MLARGSFNYKTKHVSLQPLLCLAALITFRLNQKNIHPLYHSNSALTTTSSSSSTSKHFLYTSHLASLRVSHAIPPFAHGRSAQSSSTSTKGRRRRGSILATRVQSRTVEHALRRLVGSADGGLRKWGEEGCRIEVFRKQNCTP